MGNLQQVALAGARLLLLLFGRSALLVEQSATYLPSQLTKQVGETAVFTCHFSNVDVSRSPGNWYKVSDHGQPRKISELKENLGAGAPKYPVARLDSQTFEMKIVDLATNDSGMYFCSLISFSSVKTIVDSNRANLTVTEKANAATPTPKPEPEMEEEEETGRGRQDNHTLPLAIAGGAGLLLVLAVLGYFLSNTFKRKQAAQKLCEENAPLEEEPPAVTVFTVDYGVLAFHSTESARAPPKRRESEQTEYATIVFPQEGLDKRTKKPRTCLRRAELS